MKILYVASSNAHKIREISQILRSKDFQIRGIKDVLEYQPPEETGKTFLENACIKADSLYQYLKGSCYVLADDSGLECDDLNGAPGVYSSRFSGEGSSDGRNNEKLISMLKKIPHLTRVARYVCAMVLIEPDGVKKEIVQTCEGLIHFEPQGVGGFGYDPYFYLPEYHQTMAEISAEEKNKISHRGKAMRELLAQLS